MFFTFNSTFSTFTVLTFKSFLITLFIILVGEEPVYCCLIIIALEEEI